jgi:hypothetical protein
MRYKATFTGRKVGAIGVFYPITAYLNGTDEESARLALYDNYEHISRLQLEPASIYDECVSLGIPTSNHESDLYVPLTPTTQKLAIDYGINATSFTNQVEGGLWLDLPFQFKPFWDKVASIV